MTVGTLVSWLGVALLALGVAVLAVAVVGVVRMRGLWPRLHAASKASVLGTAVILLAAVGTRDGTLIARAVLVCAFLLVTSPVAAHAIAHAAYRRERGVPEPAVADVPAAADPAGDGPSAADPADGGGAADRA